MEHQSRKDRLPLRNARHHSRAHKPQLRAVNIPEVEDEPRAQYGHSLRIQHLSARTREHARLPQHHRPVADIHRQPAAAQLAQPHHDIQLPPHVAAQADCAGRKRVVQQGHQSRSHALQLQLGYRRLRVETDERERRRHMEVRIQLRPGHRILLSADEQVRTGDGEVVRFPHHHRQQRCRRPARTEQAEASGHRQQLRVIVRNGEAAALALRPSGMEPLPLQRHFVQHLAAVQQRGRKRKPKDCIVRVLRAAVGRLPVGLRHIGDERTQTHVDGVGQLQLLQKQMPSAPVCRRHLQQGHLVRKQLLRLPTPGVLRKLYSPLSEPELHIQI